MISLRRLIADNETEQALMRAVQLLMQGIGLHAVEGDPDAFARFRQNLDELLQRVEDVAAASELPALAGSALKLLEEHNRRTTAYLKAKSVELQSMVRMLTSTISSISAAGDENVRKLRDIEQQVESASQIEDVRLVKIKLGECLDQIRREAERQKVETGRTVERLTQGLENARPGKDVSSGTDPVTGFASRKEAEDALAAACRDEVSAFAVAIQVDRMQIFNARFGYQAGDEILRYFSRFFRQQWPGKDVFFRWNDTTILALLFRPNRVERVRDEVGRVMEHKYEHTVQTASRTVLLPITLRWAVFPMLAPPLLLIRKIDAFVNTQAPTGRPA